MSGFLLVIFGGHRRLRGGAQWNDSNRVHHLRLIHHVRYKRIYIYTYTPYKMYSLLFYFFSSFFFPPFFYYYYSHLSIRWWRLLYDRLPFNCYWTDALLAFAWKHASIRQATCKRYMFFSSGCDADAQASLILCVCVCTLVGYHTIISFIRRFFDPLPYLDALISAPSISRASVFFDTLFFLLPGLD